MYVSENIALSDSNNNNHGGFPATQDPKMNNLMSSKHSRQNPQMAQQTANVRDFQMSRESLQSSSANKQQLSKAGLNIIA